MLRYFILLDETNLVKSTLTSEHVPGDGGVDGNTMPDQCLEVDIDTYVLLSTTPNYTYNNGSWVPPAAPPPPPPQSWNSSSAPVDLRSFLLRFTPGELLGLRTSEDPEVGYFWTLLTIAPTITLDHPVLTMGLDMLAKKGVLTLDRATAIQQS